jgi:multiple sugar transport system permease protein
VLATTPDVAPAEVGAATRPRRRPWLSRRRRETIAAYVFLAPDLIGLLIFVVAPMGLALGVSLYRVDGFGNYTFIGLNNFRLMAHDPILWQSVRVTLVYVATFVPIAFVVSLALAMLVRDQFPGIGWVRMAIFVPYVVSLVVIGLLWQFLLVDKQGVVPSLLRPVGLGDISLLGTPRLALGTYVLISVWFMMGYQMLIFLAGLKDIPKEFDDAALIDGAGRWQRFRYVTWPLLRPTSFFVLVTSTVGAVSGIQAFDLVYVLTKGGPANATSTLVLYIYKQAFTFSNYGYAAAITTMMVGFLVVATGVMFAVTRGGRFDVG